MANSVAYGKGLDKKRHFPNSYECTVFDAKKEGEFGGCSIHEIGSSLVSDSVNVIFCLGFALSFRIQIPFFLLCFSSVSCRSRIGAL